MNMPTKKKFLLGICLFYSFSIFAATFNSAQTGDWKDPNTWVEAGTPNVGDDVYIHDGHTVTLNDNNAYTHTGNITVYQNAEFIADTGNSSNGFIFDGDTFHLFGKLTLPVPDRDLRISGTSLFWGHPSAEVFVSDDWIIDGQSTTIIEGICVEVDDDFHIDGANTSICGGGGVSIGNNSSSNTFNLLNGATANQICLQTEVYRGAGGSCTTLVQSGTGNGEPTAVDDSEDTFMDTAVSVDVLNAGVADSDPNGGQVLEIVSVGNDPERADGLTQEGGTVSINDNGTPGDPTDDFVDFQPASGFVGTDYFSYIITDQNGAFSYAEVVIQINSILPVQLINFSGKEEACQVVLNWITESEQNNDFFEIEKSTDGLDFISMQKIKGGGNSTIYLNYRFVDPLPNARNYYRLKQTDFDGQFSYSDVIYVGSNCIKNENIGILTLFPNPVMRPEVNLRFNAHTSEETRLIVSDVYGQLVQDQSLEIEEGMNNIAVDISALPSGTYFLKAGKKSTKFTKLFD